MEHRHSATRLPALQPPILLETAAALPHVHGLSPARSTTAAPPRSGPIGGRCAQPHPSRWPRVAGRDPDGSRVHSDSLVGVGARLCPCGLAASTSQSFLAASLAAHAHRLGSSPPTRSTGARRSRPRSTRFRAGAASRGCHTPVPRVLLSIPLAEPGPSGSTGTSRLCQGCSHPPRHHPDQAALSSTVPLRRDQR